MFALALKARAGIETGLRGRGGPAILRAFGRDVLWPFPEERIWYYRRGMLSEDQEVPTAVAAYEGVRRGIAVGPALWCGAGSR